MGLTIVISKIAVWKIDIYWLGWKNKCYYLICSRLYIFPKCKPVWRNFIATIFFFCRKKWVDFRACIRNLDLRVESILSIFLYRQIMKNVSCDSRSAYLISQNLCVQKVMSQRFVGSCTRCTHSNAFPGFFKRRSR